MGARHDHRFARAFAKVPLLLLVAGATVLVGALPGDSAGAASKTPPGDPPGNNGTIKIERDAPNPPENTEESEANNANEPHVDGCMFWIEFYGFDQGQTADITFTHVKSKKELIVDRAVPISDDPAGGGQDLDAVIGYNLTSVVQGLEAHPKHGYHIKVASNSNEAPGGAKQKVFWIKCAPEPATTLRISKALQGSGSGPFTFDLTCNHRVLDRTFTLQAGEKLDITDVPPGTVCKITETDTKGAQSTTITEDPAHGKADDGEIRAKAGTATIVRFTNVFPGNGSIPAPPDTDLRPPAGTPTSGGTGGTAGTAANSDSSVLGETVTRPEQLATLPRTGGTPTPLAVSGLWSLAAGSLMLLAGRRLRRS